MEVVGCDCSSSVCSSWNGDGDGSGWRGQICTLIWRVVHFGWPVRIGRLIFGFTLFRGVGVMIEVGKLGLYVDWEEETINVNFSFNHVNVVVKLKSLVSLCIKTYLLNFEKNWFYDGHHLWLLGTQLLPMIKTF